jgi:ADP-heptose:LPS heptosyltransferase
MTDYPDIVNNESVDKLLKFTRENFEIIKNINFNLAINLDKEMICCELIKQVPAKEKKWYHHKDMKILPIDKDAEYLFERGISDSFMKKDTRHYIDEIFEVCGLIFNEEKYILPKYVVPNAVRDWLDSSKKKIWLNTGTSWTWKTRLRKNENWIELAQKLLNQWYEVIILGWPAEDEKNKEISSISWAKYFWTFDFKNFIWIVSLVDIMLTQVTFAMHVAIGLWKKTVLFNNIFNNHEYHFYDIPYKIIEPDVNCKMCYKSKYDSKCEVPNCMDTITTSNTLSAIDKLLYNW